MKLLILAVFSVGLALGQECQEEVMGFASCVKDAMADDVATLQEFKAQKMQLVQQCFVDNGCEAPQGKSEEEKECMKEVIRTEVGGQMQECLAGRDVEVSDELLDMAFESGRKMMKLFKVMRMGRMGRRMERKLARKADKLCPSEESAAAVVACASALKEQALEEIAANRPDIGAKIATVMQCKQQELSDECFEQMKETKQDLCACGQEMQDDEELADAIADGLQECKADEDDDDDVEGDDDGDDDEEDDSESDSDSESGDSDSDSSSSSGSGEGKLQKKVARKMRKILKVVCRMGGKGPFRGGPFGGRRRFN